MDGMSSLTTLRGRLRLVGAALLAAAVVVPLLLILTAVDGADMKPETYIEGSGTAQDVAVAEGRSMMLWFDNSVTSPECSVTGEDGSAVELSGVEDGPTQSAGTAGDYVGTLTFEAPGDSVQVACDGPGEPATGALLTPAPRLLAGLSGIAVIVAVALLLALAGLGCVARAVTQERSRQA